MFGRSSSHFTRTARIFANELGVAHTFQVITDLRALVSDAYGGNPALRMPTLLSPNGHWFGSLNICRELGRHATHPRRIVWPEQLHTAALCNTQELTLQAMSSAVELIMNDAPNSALAVKRRESLEGSLRWLNENVATTLSSLPERDLSYLEVTLYCLVTHLEFREVLSTEPYPALRAFATSFGERESARQTPFRFDR